MGPCPTCSHPMESIGATDNETTDLYWCLQCGTINFDEYHPIEAKSPAVPKLVERCREFRKCLGADHMSQHIHCRDEWKRLGIAESINTPENRS